MQRKRSVSEIDLLIGNNIRRARLALGWSQDAMGMSLEPQVAGQQVGRYELAIHRVSAAYLHQIARLSGRSMEWFTVKEENDVAA